MTLSSSNTSNTSETNQLSLIFNGELLPNVNRADCLKQLSQLTNLDESDLLERLFSIKPVLVQQTQDAQLIERLQQGLNEAGLITELVATTPEHDDYFCADIEFGHYAPLEKVEIAPNYVIDSAALDEKENRTTTDSSSGKYALIFNGALRAGIKKTAAINNLAHLTNSDPKEITEQVFSVIPLILYKHDDEFKVKEFQAILEIAGLITELSPTEEVDDLPQSFLQIRNDAPEPPLEKPVEPFTWGLLGLAGLMFLSWLSITIWVDKIFNDTNTQTLSVRLQSYVAPQNPEVPQPTIEKKEPKQIDEQPVTPKPEKKTQTLEPKPKPKPKQETSTKPNNTPVPQSNTEKTDTIKQNYFLVLLNHYASFGVKKQGLEGDVTLALRIGRTGDLMDVEVLSSSSNGLADIAKEQAYRAAPYPKMPAELKGNSYRFTLPLSYQVER